MPRVRLGPLEVEGRAFRLWSRLPAHVAVEASSSSPIPGVIWFIMIPVQHPESVGEVRSGSCTACTRALDRGDEPDIPKGATK